MIRKMLCAIDGSIASSKAVDVAVELARQTGAALTFLTVEHASAASTANSAFWDSRIVDAADAQTHQVLGHALARARSMGMDAAQCATTTGSDIPAAVAGYAENHGFDHIVVGSVGRTGVARLLLGSVAQGVVARAHCPVTVAR